MKAQGLIDTAKTLAASDKGLLAMDESHPTCHKRFARLGEFFPVCNSAQHSHRRCAIFQ
jgi:fructose-bisphosphate aldolase class I